jgi:hypothetical protein
MSVIMGGIREFPQEPSRDAEAALLEKARAYRPYNVLNDGALVQALVSLVEDLQFKLALAGPLYSARQLQPKLDEAYDALEAFSDALDGCDDDKAGAGAHIWEAPVAMNITYGDLRRARSVLENRKAGLADAHSNPNPNRSE